MDRPFSIVPFSAGSADSLSFLLKEFPSDVNANDPISAGDLEYTLLSSGNNGPWRAFVVASDTAGASGMLLDAVGAVRKYYSPRKRGRPVFLFPGGGAQHVNMARQIYLSETFFGQTVDEGIGYARELTGVDYLALLYPSREEANAEITDPEVALPLLFVIEYSIARYLIHLGLAPGAMMGHSLGEYVAAATAGVFSYRDAVKIVCRRGALMKKVEAGLMLSVAAGADVVRGYLDIGISIGAINSPGHCMLSGRKEDVKRLKSRLECDGIQVKVIHISVASHSAMMDPILNEFREVFAGIEIHPPSIPFVSNLTGDWVEGYLPDADYWTSHLRNTVRFSDGLLKLAAAFPDSVLIESGPGNTLANLCRLHFSDPQKNPVINVLRHPLGAENDVSFFLQAIGELWANGYPIDRDAYFAGQSRKKIMLPWDMGAADQAIPAAPVFTEPDVAEHRMEKAKGKMGLMRSISKSK
jgi:acyl transferase domain-containing protein